jgi:hypothetical protein
MKNTFRTTHRHITYSAVFVTSVLLLCQCVYAPSRIRIERFEYLWEREWLLNHIYILDEPGIEDFLLLLNQNNLTSSDQVDWLYSARTLLLSAGLSVEQINTVLTQSNAFFAENGFNNTLAKAFANYLLAEFSNVALWGDFDFSTFNLFDDFKDIVDFLESETEEVHEIFNGIEILDTYLPSNPHSLEEAPTNEVYLIHGYKKRYDKEINAFVDTYVCDSLFPYLEVDHTKRLYFFKRSRNTNRENFQTNRKYKIIRAWSNDILFSYWFYNINDSIIPRTKYYHAVGGKEDPPSQKFQCD